MRNENNVFIIYSYKSIIHNTSCKHVDCHHNSAPRCRITEFMFQLREPHIEGQPLLDAVRPFMHRFIGV